MITIIDYGAGNIGSLKNALTSLGFDCLVTSDPKIIAKADKIIFPGQGRAGSAIKELKKRGLDKIIKKINVPFLGICLGMQILADYSEEDNTNCLGIIPGEVKKFSNSLKIPQIGWNKIKISRVSRLLKGIKDSEYFYFVNSYFLCLNNYTIAETSYGLNFSAVIQKDNFYGVQFHPEKSGKIGLKILNNFCKL